VTKEYNKDTKGDKMKELIIKLKEGEFSGRVIEWNAFENY